MGYIFTSYSAWRSAGRRYAMHLHKSHRHIGWISLLSYRYGSAPQNGRRRNCMGWHSCLTFCTCLIRRHSITLTRRTETQAGREGRRSRQEENLHSKARAGGMAYSGTTPGTKRAPRRAFGTCCRHLSGMGECSCYTAHNRYARVSLRRPEPRGRGLAAPHGDWAAHAPTYQQTTALTRRAVPPPPYTTTY